MSRPRNLREYNVDRSAAARWKHVVASAMQTTTASVTRALSNNASLCVCMVETCIFVSLDRLGVRTRYYYAQQQGWPDKWQTGRGWSLAGNSCLWCPDDRCGTHHESPINLQRARALPENEEYNKCIDVHWMQYHDSTCSFETLKATNSIRIDRHALRVIQPMRISEDTGEYEVDCRIVGEGRRFGRIDFSKGFSAWWYLSHIDFHVPSEHTQEGKRYDAELQMYHFYSKTGEEAGIDNEVRTVKGPMSTFSRTRLISLHGNA
jgi:Eukaryotic-type carbonic anhydrase